MWAAGTWTSGTWLAGVWQGGIAEPAVPPAPTFTASGGARIYGGGQSVRMRHRRDDELIWMGGRK